MGAAACFGGEVGSCTPAAAEEEDNDDAAAALALAASASASKDLANLVFRRALSTCIFKDVGPWSERRPTTVNGFVRSAAFGFSLKLPVTSYRFPR